MIEIFAHRGASMEATDNSPEAIRKALAIGVDGIEIDCQMTTDGIPIVAHDDPHATWAEAKAIGIPTLQEILKIIQPSKVKIILDIKKQRGWTQKGPRLIINQALEILPPKRMLASSFSLRYLMTLKAEFPLLGRAFIIKPTAFKLVPPQIFAKLLPIVSLHPWLKGLKKPWVEKWQAKGFKIYTWVANTEKELERCMELGVDGVFTDDPRLAKKVLKNG